MANHNLLDNIYLFKGLDATSLDSVKDICTTETFAPGDDIFSQGDASKSLFVIKYGSVRIHQKSSEGDNIEITTLATGSHFGEMSFLDGGERSASATAIEKSDIIQLDYDKLKTLLDAEIKIAVHFYRELSHFLCGRLRITTTDLSFSREQNLSHF